jgi:uncharacterized membrane protein
MSPTNPRQRLWFVIIALLAVVIIVGSYFLLVNSGDESVEILSPDEVMGNSDEYVGKTIAVDGYYSPEAEGRGVITSSIIQDLSSLTNYKRLPVDHSRVNLSLKDEVKYRFTGVLIEEETDFGSSVVLVAEKISQV